VDPGVTFNAAVTANELAIAFALSNTITVNGAAVTGLVPAGKTLKIAGVVTPSAALTVNNGGTLQVLSGAGLVLTTSAALDVKAGGVAQVLSGGALSISQSGAIVTTATDPAGGAIRAKNIGTSYVNAHGSADDYGAVTFASGAKLVATNVLALTDEAFVATGTVNFIGNPTITDTILASLAAVTGQTLDITGDLTWGATAAKTIAADSTINVSGGVTQLAGGTKLTVNGTLSVTGTYDALANLAATDQYIDGTGVVLLGTLSIVATSAGDVGFAIKVVNATKPAVGDLAITGITTSSRSAKLLLDGAGVELVVTGTATLTKDGSGDATIEGAGASEQITFAAGSELAAVGGPDLKSLVDQSHTSDTTYTWGGANW
jgi:hypothetical protein